VVHDARLRKVGDRRDPRHAQRQVEVLEIEEIARIEAVHRIERCATAEQETAAGDRHRRLLAIPVDVAQLVGVESAAEERAQCARRDRVRLTTHGRFQ